MLLVFTFDGREITYDTPLRQADLYRRYDNNGMVTEKFAGLIAEFNARGIVTFGDLARSWDLDLEKVIRDYRESLEGSFKNSELAWDAYSGMYKNLTDVLKVLSYSKENAAKVGFGNIQSPNLVTSFSYTSQLPSPQLYTERETAEPGKAELAVQNGLYR